MISLILSLLSANNVACTKSSGKTKPNFNRPRSAMHWNHERWNIGRHYLTLNAEKSLPYINELLWYLLYIIIFKYSFKIGVFLFDFSRTFIQHDCMAGAIGTKVLSYRVELQLYQHFNILRLSLSTLTQLSTNKRLLELLPASAECDGVVEEISAGSKSQLVRKGYTSKSFIK